MEDPCICRLDIRQMYPHHYQEYVEAGGAPELTLIDEAKAETLRIPICEASMYHLATPEIALLEEDEELLNFGEDLEVWLEYYETPDENGSYPINQ